MSEATDVENTPITCKHCERRLDQRFDVTHFSRQGTRRGTISVCSILCLIQWAYSYGVRRGLAGIVAARDFLKQITIAARGEKP